MAEPAFLNLTKPSQLLLPLYTYTYLRNLPTWSESLLACDRHSCKWKRSDGLLYLVGSKVAIGVKLTYHIIQWQPNRHDIARCHRIVSTDQACTCLKSTTRLCTFGGAISSTSKAEKKQGKALCTQRLMMRTDLRYRAFILPAESIQSSLVIVMHH